MGRTIDPNSEIVVTCGSTEAMMTAMMTVTNPGDKVVIFSPFYENYGADTILTGAEPIYVPLTPPEFTFDPEVLENAFRQHPKALILCNPSNPCGKVFTREDLMQKVWNYDYFGDMRTVDVTVRRLREKIEDNPAAPAYILTRRGVGYYFSAQA